jgi:uncharacterized protein
MNNTIQSERGGTVLLGALLAVGLILGGWALGAQIKAVRLADRYVTVRGLAERDVKSDLAIWTLQYRENGDDLTAMYSKAEADKKIILEFLSKHGVQESEIHLGMVNVTDYSERVAHDRFPYRYSADQQIIISSGRVDEIADAAQQTIELLQKGIILGGNAWQGQNVAYKFTGLNSVKPDMITEATRNARAAAQRFANDSGSQLGAIRQAYQGVFTILPARSGVASDEDGGGNPNEAEASIMKTVRVVTTVEYYLNK